MNFTVLYGCSSIPALFVCPRLFEELKTQYEQERDRFVRKVAALETDKPRLEAALETHSASQSSLEATNRALEKLLRFNVLHRKNY